MPQPVEVLIPHWNGAERLRSALEALRRQTHVPAVCVIDNGSSDRSGAVATQEFPEVRYLGLDRNYGFGAALNRGVETSPAGLVVFLNNDTVADSRLVERVLEVHAAEGAEMLALGLRMPNGPIDSLGVEIDSCLNAYDVARGEAYGDPGHALLPPPLGPTGGAAAFAREALLAVGGFDEAIFAYLEDVDLAIRMRMEGMRCALVYGAYAWHWHSSTLGPGSAAKNRLLARSKGYLLRKYGANLALTDRIRARVADAVVYTGKAIIDRNLSAFGGRLESARESRGRPRPDPDPRFARVPTIELSFRDGLHRRLARRR